MTNPFVQSKSRDLKLQKLIFSGFTVIIICIFDFSDIERHLQRKAELECSQGFFSLQGYSLFLILSAIYYFSFYLIVMISIYDDFQEHSLVELELRLLKALEICPHVKHLGKFSLFPNHFYCIQSNSIN